MAWYSLIEEKGSVFVCCQVLPPSLVVSSAVFWCVSPEKDWLIIHPWFWSENEKDCTFPCTPRSGFQVAPPSGVRYQVPPYPGSQPVVPSRMYISSSPPTPPLP